jgi:hypothetical protein
MRHSLDVIRKTGHETLLGWLRGQVRRRASLEVHVHGINELGLLDKLVSKEQYYKEGNGEVGRDETRCVESAHYHLS